MHVAREELERSYYANVVFVQALVGGPEAIAEELHQQARDKLVTVRRALLADVRATLETEPSLWPRDLHAHTSARPQIGARAHWSVGGLVCWHLVGPTQSMKTSGCSESWAGYTLGMHLTCVG